MSFEIDKPFNLEEIRLEELNKLILRALEHFEDNPGICWTQIPMEKPLWETLQLLIEKQILKRPDFQDNDHESWGECPVCGESIPEYIEENETECYCLGCGQKLGWEWI